MLSIRPTTEADAQALLEIYSPYVENTAISFEYQTPTLEEFCARIRNIGKRYPYLVAVLEGRIVGYAYAAEFKSRPAYRFSVESTIYVQQSERGNGVGKALYQKLEEELKRRGFFNMNACIASPREENDPFLTDASIRFHTAMGFSPVGTFHQCAYKFHRWYDMIWMEKSLGSHPAEPIPFLFDSDSKKK